MEESEIIRLCKAGDRSAFQSLFDLHRGLIESVCWRMVKNREEVLEVAQEILIKIYKGFGTFNGNSRLSTWIYRVAVNENLRYLSARKNGKTESLSIIEEAPSDAPGPLSRVIEAQERETLRGHVHALPGEFKAVVVMYYFGCMKAEEIAENLNLPVGTIHSRISRARSMIRERIEAEASCAL